MKVYRYGLLPPTLGAERVVGQFRAAHRYQHALVAIERSRREEVRAAMSRHGDVAAQEGRAAAALADLERARAAIRAQRSEDRAKSEPHELREAAKRCRGLLGAAWADLRAAKAALREDIAAQAEIGAANATARDRAKRARSECGVYWGTYLQIEQAMDAARKALSEPRFRRWTGDAAVAVQMQHGLSVEAALGGEDTRLRIGLAPQPVPDRGGQPLPRVSLRVGSDGRDPVWAEWPLVYHRGLPADGLIKWAKVVRRSIAARQEWSLHLTVETAERRPGAVAGVVAVDLGWRLAGAPETLRAGGWAGDDGESAEVLLSKGIRGALRKAEDLRSIRDTRQNEMHAALLDWRREHPVPTEHAERWQQVAQWRSPARFAGLALYWREHRWPGDDDGFALIESWRRKDKHLWQWETNARRKAHARRRDEYRVLAARLAARYATLVVERINLAEMALIPQPESTKESHPRARAQRFEVAPHELRSVLVNAFRARAGGTIATVPAAGPASALLASYRERSGVEEIAAPARSNRFRRLREEKAAREADAGPNA